MGPGVATARIPGRGRDNPFLLKILYKGGHANEDQIPENHFRHDVGNRACVDSHAGLGIRAVGAKTARDRIGFGM